MRSIQVMLLATLIVLVSIGSAQAQFGNYFNGPGGALTDTGIPVDPTNAYVLVQNNFPCVTPTCTAFIPLTAFGGRFQGQIDTLSRQIDTLNNQVSRSYQLIAASAAMKDAIPNFGD